MSAAAVWLEQQGHLQFLLILAKTQGKLKVRFQKKRDRTGRLYIGWEGKKNLYSRGERRKTRREERKRKGKKSHMKSENGCVPR